MTRNIPALPLTREAFAWYGQILDADGWQNHYPINDGRCERFHDLATAEAYGKHARVIMSVFRATPYAFPLKLKMMERHPFGSQAFMPLSPRPFLVVVAHDDDGKPGTPHAFITKPGQGVNYPRGLWHGVLTPIGEPQDFLVIDRAGDEKNVEEHHFKLPWKIHLPEGST